MYDKIRFLALNHPSTGIASKAFGAVSIKSFVVGIDRAFPRPLAIFNRLDTKRPGTKNSKVALDRLSMKQGALDNGLGVLLIFDDLAGKALL